MKNIRLAIRSLLHFKLYSAVNIFGLALCLVCVIVIARYVHIETTVDHFNSKLDRIYLTTQERDNWAGGIVFYGPRNPNNDKTFVNICEDPGVEKSSYFIRLSDHVMKYGDIQHTLDVVIADTAFLQILDFPISTGIRDLSAPDNILITEELARKVFGDKDPLGEQFTYLATGKTVTVTGILTPPRTKSSIAFDAIVPYNHSRMWQWTPQSLVLLYPNQDYKVINEKYSDFFEASSWSASTRYQLFPFEKVYMDSTVQKEHAYLSGKHTSILILTIVGLLILLVGVCNFINIYTAVVLRRGREFGMKKVFGAPGGQVFAQLLVENLLMIGFALLIALAITEILNPVVRNLLGFDQMPFRRFDLFVSLGLLVILPLITTILPFIHYNYSAPVKALQSVGKTGGRSAGRRILLTFQYILTIGMIVVSLFFLKQLRFMLNADPGFETEDIIKVPFFKDNLDYENMGISWKDKIAKHKELQQRVGDSPLFVEYAMGSSPIRTWSGAYNYRLFEEGNELKNVTVVHADERWLKLFGIEISEGRLFDNDIENFYTYNLMATESALPYFGITDFRTQKLQPEHRLWHSSLRPEEEMKINVPYDIVGVAKDFYPSHMAIKIPPVIISFNESWVDDPLLAKIAPGRNQEAIEFLRALHSEFIGGDFEYTFLEDDLKGLYDEDRKIATVYSIFTVIAILVSVLGLFSLSLFDIQQRRREIAIRKVNGATTGNILGLLLKRYLLLLGISFVIAAPIGYFAIRKYLENFAHKASVSWWIFAAALLVTAGVSLLTLIWQTRKAANANPAEVIRSE